MRGLQLLTRSFIKRADGVLPLRTGACFSTASSEKQTVRLVLKNGDVATLIGARGASVKKLSKDSGAFVKFLNTAPKGKGKEAKEAQTGATEKEHAAVILGTVEHNAHAVRLMAENLLVKANMMNHAVPETEWSFTFLIQDSLMGALIGKGGANIKVETNVKFNITTFCMPESTERKVTVKGTPENLQSACTRMLQTLQDHHSSSDTNGRQYDPSAVVEEFTQKIVIPECYKGFVIGQAGRNIEYMRTRTGATIGVAKPEPEDEVVTIKGSPASIAVVIDMINKRIAKAPPQKSSESDSDSSSDSD